MDALQTILIYAASLLAVVLVSAFGGFLFGVAYAIERTKRKP